VAADGAGEAAAGEQGEFVHRRDQFANTEGVDLRIGAAVAVRNGDGDGVGAGEARGGRVRELAIGAAADRAMRRSGGAVSQRIAIVIGGGDGEGFRRARWREEENAIGADFGRRIVAVYR